MSEIGPKSRPPLATELYAAGRLIGNKCFDENFEVSRAARRRAAQATLLCAAHTALRVHATRRRAKRSHHAAPHMPICTAHATLHRARRAAPPAKIAPADAPRPRPQFLACKNKDEKPSACLAQGEAVHKCVYDLYQEIAKKAQKEFAAHAKCLDGSDLRTQECKKTQRAFETAYYSQS